MFTLWRGDRAQPGFVAFKFASRFAVVAAALGWLAMEVALPAVRASAWRGARAFFSASLCTQLLLANNSRMGKAYGVTSALTGDVLELGSYVTVIVVVMGGGTAMHVSARHVAAVAGWVVGVYVVASGALGSFRNDALS